jgi:hypothetical protein
MKKHLPCPLCSSTSLREYVFTGEEVMRVACEKCGFHTLESMWRALPRKATPSAAGEAMDRLVYLTEGYDELGIESGMWDEMLPHVQQELIKAYSGAK